MDVLLSHAKRHSNPTQRNPYINPHFLMEIDSALDTYFNLDNDEVSEWIENMFGQ